MKIKKFMTGALAAAMAMSMSVPAMAAFDPATKDVTGTYSADSTQTVYSAKYSIGSMEFTYGASSSGTWDPATHQYSGGSSGGWSCAKDANKITVENHSNAPLKATLSFAAAEGSGITGGFDKATLQIASAVGTDVANPPTADAYFSITGGSLTSGQKGVKLGTITIQLAGA